MNEKPDFNIGDTVTTTFNRNETHKERIIESIQRYVGRSESGWEITTRCGISADSSWFEKVPQ